MDWWGHLSRKQGRDPEKSPLSSTHTGLREGGSDPKGCHTQERSQPRADRDTSSSHSTPKMHPLKNSTDLKQEPRPAAFPKSNNKQGAVPCRFPLHCRSRLIPTVNTKEENHPKGDAVCLKAQMDGESRQRSRAEAWQVWEQEGSGEKPMGSDVVGRKSNGNSASHAQQTLTPGATCRVCHPGRRGHPLTTPKHPSPNKLFPPSGPQGQASWLGLSGHRQQNNTSSYGKGP